MCTEAMKRMLVWKRNLDTKQYKEQLKLFLGNSFSRRSMGQMKLETLEDHFLSIATQNRLNELRKEKEDDSQPISVLLSKKRREEEIEKKKNSDQHVTLDELVKNQQNENPFQEEIETEDEFRTHCKDVEDWLDKTTSEDEVDKMKENISVEKLVEDKLPVRKILKGNSSKIVIPTVEQLRAEREADVIRRDEIRRGVLPKIVGWKFDIEEKAIIVKRVGNMCSYFRSTSELLKLSNDDLNQLNKIKMVNHGMFPHGTEVEALIRKHASNNFKGLKRTSSKRKRSTMFLDKDQMPTEDVRKVDKPVVIGWRMDGESHEIVIERADGSEDRLYEDSDIRRLCLNDRKTMYKLPFRNCQDDPDGEHFLQVLNFSVERLLDKKLKNWIGAQPGE